MERLSGLELLDCIAKAKSQGKSWQKQCIEAGYVNYGGKPDPQDFGMAVDRAEMHVEIIQAGGLHPFLLHGYSKTPVARQSKRLNAIIEEFSKLVSLSYIDGMEEDFMDNFDETGDPDGCTYEYEFGTFDSQTSAREYIVHQLEAGWWISYFENEMECFLLHSGFRGEALSLMARIEEQGGSDLLHKLIPEAMSKRFEGVVKEKGIEVSTLIVMREWECEDLVKWLGEGGSWESLCLSLRNVCEVELPD
jgi:hypothetical protein